MSSADQIPQTLEDEHRLGWHRHHPQEMCLECSRERTEAALATAQKRIEELEAALEAIEKVVEMALECDESMEWLADKMEAVLGKVKP